MHHALQEVDQDQQVVHLTEDVLTDLNADPIVQVDLIADQIVETGQNAQIVLVSEASRASLTGNL